MKHHFLILFLLILCFSIENLFAQNLIESRRTSHLTYVYKLYDDEAINVYKKGLEMVEESYFHTLIQTYPTDSAVDLELNPGHYLITWTDRENLNFELVSHSNIEVKILNNGADMNLILHDLSGTEVVADLVKLDGKRIPFNKSTRSYFLKGSNKKGLLEIEYEGVKTFTFISREFNNSKFRRFSRKILYSVPLKYLWIPISTVLQSPYDLFQSVRLGRPTGIFYYIVKPFREVVNSIRWGEPQGFVEKVFCRFDHWYCYEDRYDGYLVFNKPKYLPGDTVKFKAFITNKKGSPIKKDTEIMLSGRNGFKTKQILKSLSPYRKGAFEYEFALHDSLDLLLDNTYSISLEDKKSDVYINGQFEYEDYELKSNQYEFRADKENHFQGQDVNLYASGTDINGLNLFDVQMNLVVLSKLVDESFDDHVIVPDTLWSYDQKLENIGETKVVLPDSIFPRANFTYEVKATFLNAENEKKEKTIELSYSYRKEQVTFDAVRDSLVISKKRNGQEIPERVDLKILNGEFEEIESMKLDLPAKIKINPFAHIYRLEDGKNTEKWRLENVPSELQVLSTRDSDSLSIGVENPRNLLFRYFIYEENKEIHKGSGTDLKFEFKNRIKGKYFISIHYVWADEVVSENYEVTFKDKQLKIKVFEPGNIYPGQEAEIKVLVKDASGDAVENVDLSAFAFTKKFENTQVQAVPYFGKTYQDRKLINNFADKGTTLSEQTETRLLDWQLWNARMHLDSIEYYKFLYPVLNYSSTLSVPDSLTQFAPYLVKEGKMQPIYIIYVDNRPVYFSVSSEFQRYAFAAEPGYHEIRLRTSNYEAIVDSLYFEKGVKNIFSFLMDTVNHKIKLVKKPLSLTNHENNLISRHLIAIENNVRFVAPTYLKQDSKIFWINEQGNSQRNYVLGPVYAKEASYVRSGKDTLDFDLEQNYHYSFQKNFIKMKKNENIYYSKFLTDVQKNYPLDEIVLTEKEIKKISEEKKTLKQATGKSFKNPSTTKKGNGKLQVLLDESQLKNRFVKNIIVLKDDEPQFFRVYAGLNNKIFHDLVPGVYSTFILLDNNSYFRRKNIRIEKNALTLINMLTDSLRDADDKSDLINQKVRELQEYGNDDFLSLKEESREIKEAILEEERVNRYSGKTIFGVVRDTELGDPIPGVNVIIKGTQIGTITNLDGEYSIKVSEDYSTLLVSFIGYMTEELKIGSSQELNVTLSPDIQQLSEVVVVGYGVQQRRSLTGSVTTIETSGIMNRNLQGRVAGIAVSGEPGKKAIIQIRGISASNTAGTPLYVVNGIPYSGRDLDISPDMIERIEVLNSNAATSIYGSRAENGVILITLKEGAEVLNTILSNNTFMEAMENSSSIRNNFSDYAYWEPKLRTDENGFASFKVKFPDDITAWKTHVLGMTEKKQSGQYEGEIKSFKTVAGTLATPTFLIAGDTTSLIGKVLNYTSDSLDIDMSFEADSVLLYTASHKIQNAKIDTLHVIAPLAADSVSFQYKITKADGYFDGELRSVPVLKRGVQETSGQFFVLENDTTLTYTLPFRNQSFSVTASSNVLQVLMDEADHIRRYEYLCNEQIASKVKALIALKTIKEFQEEQFKYDNLLRRLIKNLHKNQKNGLWGWWPESAGNYWISFHVLEALLEAEKHGYKLDIDRQVVIDRLVYNLEIKEDAEKIRILKMLSLLNAPFAYKEHLDSLEKRGLRLAEFAQVQLLKQKLALPYALDSLLKQQKETMFGGIYWEEAEDKVYRNSVMSTLYVYELIKNSKNHEVLLSKIRNYFLETRRSMGYWRNTYESANILTAILPDLLKKDERFKAPFITINGIENKDGFPFEKIFGDAEQVHISKTGTGPVYLSVYQQFWNETPDKVEEELVITTSFENDKKSFKAGQQESMIVELNVAKDAEFIMLEIPIPAGFSYVNKTKQPFEDHREYFKHKVNIYFSSLKVGSYDLKIDLLPRFSGNYAINPAKAELMYFPVFFGRNEGKRIEVK